MPLDIIAAQPAPQLPRPLLGVGLRNVAQIRQIDHVLFEREHRIDDPTCLGPAIARAIDTPKRAPSEDPALAWSDDTIAQDHFGLTPSI